MKVAVKFEGDINDLKNKPINDEEKKAVTIKDCCIRALLYAQTQKQGEGPTPQNILVKRAMLAEKLEAANGELDLKSEQVSLIKDCVTSLFNSSPLVVYRVLSVIDPASCKDE
jgi:hypothetical protein